VKEEEKNFKKLLIEEDDFEVDNTVISYTYPDNDIKNEKSFTEDMKNV